MCNKCTTRLLFAQATVTLFRELHVHYIIKGWEISETHVERAIKLSSEKYCGASITVARSRTKMKYTHEIIDVSKA